MNDVVIYNSGEVELKVPVDSDTIWLTQKQIAELFDVQVPAISKHINNIFAQNELIENMVVSKMEITTKHGAISNKTQSKEVKVYNLDIVLAVGYRTNSLKAIHFRKWATSVLKNYIVNGYAVNTHKITEQRLINLENDMVHVKSHIKNNTLDLKQGIFYDGQVFDAYSFVSDLIRSAKESIKIIDNYCDDTVLTLLSKNQDINITIYTHTVSKQLKLDIQKYNTQYKPIKLKTFKSSHDRFIIIDDSEIYHIGASLKDLGKKWFAFSKMDKSVVNILERIDSGG
jgi:hypothetical protein